MDGLERFGNAVVMQAVRDWRYATRKLKRNPGNYESKRLKKDCEQFFLSQYFDMYTDLDGRALLDKLRKMENRPPPNYLYKKGQKNDADYQNIDMVVLVVLLQLSSGIFGRCNWFSDFLLSHSFLCWINRWCRAITL